MSLRERLLKRITHKLKDLAMALTAAQKGYLHELARQLAAAPPSDGTRAALMERAAATLGKTTKTVYDLLKKHTDWVSGRKKRSDKGETCVDRELAMLAGGLPHLSKRQNGKQITSIKAACERLAANGHGIMDPATGETVMPSARTVARAMRRFGCHPTQLAVARPAVELRSLHPNHTWEMDASICVLYRMKNNPTVRLINERDYNAHKPNKLIEIAGQRIIRYIIVDHFSSNIYLHYEQSRGEDAWGVIHTLVEGISDRGERDPMHGAPLQIFMDKGSGNKSSLVTQFLRDLDIRPLWHEAGNARATGAVEVAQKLVENGFESRLRFMVIPDMETLQREADRWRRHFNAHAVLTRAGKTRNQIWAGITDAQLRTVERPVLEAIAHWEDLTRQIDHRFRISVNTRSHGVQEYDLRELGYHGLSAKDTVKVRLNPFRAPCIMLFKEMPDGRELAFEVSPILKDEAGRDMSAPVIGEEWRRPPETLAERNLKEIKLRAYGTDSIEEAEKAHKNRNRTPFADLDMMADVREAPQYLRRNGRVLDVEGKTATPVPLNRAQAANRLMEMCGEAWSANPVACNDLIRARFPQQVPEEALPELAEAIMARFAPRPASVLHFREHQGEQACAN